MKCQQRESVHHSSLHPLSVLLFLSFGKCLLQVCIHVGSEKKRKRKECPSSAMVFASLCFLLESPSFFVFDLSTRCLTYAQQSTIVTRNRNFLSMVLIKYPHQYREEEEEDRKRGGNGVRGGRKPMRDERFFFPFCFKMCPVTYWKHLFLNLCGLVTACLHLWVF